MVVRCQLVPAFIAASTKFRAPMPDSPSIDDPSGRSRREFLRAASAAVSVPALGSLAGCVEVRVPSDALGDGDGAFGSGDGSSNDDAGSTNTGGGDFDAETRDRAGEVGQRVQQSVVKLTQDRTGGTGWLFDDGYVVTNAHVAAEFQAMDVETFDGRTGTAERVGYERDLRPDLALLRTDVDSPPALETTDVDALAEGDPVVSVGHPGAVGDWVISLGRFRTFRESLDWVLADVPTASGSSGSPLVTLDGRVVGCVSGATRSPNDDTVDRPDDVYTDFPEEDRLASAVPSATVEESVAEWRG